MAKKLLFYGKAVCFAYFLSAFISAPGFAQGTFASSAGGNWSTLGWSFLGDADGKPDADDQVTIASNHTVTLDQNATIAQLTVGTGNNAKLQFGTASNYTLSVSGDVAIGNSATLEVQNSGDRKSVV